MARLDDAMFVRIAERFKALGEPTRLRILDALRQGEATVGELVEATQLNQANLSKHLQLLHHLGFVGRAKRGLFVYYRLTDEDVFRICDVMCGRIEQLHRMNAVVRPSRAARPRRRPRPRTRPAERKR